MFDDWDVGAIKTARLTNAEIVKVVAALLGVWVRPLSCAGGYANGSPSESYGAQRQ